MNFKKKIISTIIFVLLFILAYLFVFKNYSITEFLNTIKNCRYEYIIIAIICVFFWVFFEALFFKIIFKKLNYKISWYQAFGYVFTEFYFSAITPSSTGGQPVQMIEMRKDKIPYRISSIIVLINTMFYKLSLILIVTVGFIVYHDKIKDFSSLFKGFSIFGYIITLAIALFFLILIFSNKIITKLVNWFYKLLDKLKIRKNDSEKQKKLDASIEEYKEAAKYIRKNYKVMFITFIVIFLQRTSLLMVNYFIYKAFNIDSISICFALTIQAFLTIAADFIPLPGGVIVSEALLIEINNILQISSISKSITLVFRNINFYLLVLVSLIYYIIFHYSKRKEAQKITDNQE